MHFCCPSCLSTYRLTTDRLDQGGTARFICRRCGVTLLIAKNGEDSGQLRVSTVVQSARTTMVMEPVRSFFDPTPPLPGEGAVDPTATTVRLPATAPVQPAAQTPDYERLLKEFSVLFRLHSKKRRSRHLMAAALLLVVALAGLGAVVAGLAPADRAGLLALVVQPLQRLVSLAPGEHERVETAPLPAATLARTDAEVPSIELPPEMPWQKLTEVQVSFDRLPVPRPVVTPAVAPVVAVATPAPVATVTPPVEQKVLVPTPVRAVVAPVRVERRAVVRAAAPATARTPAPKPAQLEANPGSKPAEPTPGTEAAEPKKTLPQILDERLDDLAAAPQSLTGQGKARADESTGKDAAEETRRAVEALRDE